MRALRRHHRERLKKKRLDYYGGFMRQSSLPNIKRRVGKAIDTPQPCSCYACGNQRHVFMKESPTIQERRAALVGIEYNDFNDL